MAGRAFVSRFSPNRTDPDVLESIFVQRHKLAETWLERLRDSVLTGVKHHLLAVGPRGCGKSHLVALLVGRLRKDPAVRERVRIAWLPEDETTPSFWKFLLRVLRALNAEYGDEFPPPAHDQLADEADDRRSAVLTDHLLKKLNGRTLLVVVENLDDVMRGLKAEGQKRWRAFLQEHPVAATLATAQRLTKDVANRDRPFFNFFQIEHLQALSADEALSLLQKIAAHINNTSLVSFLETPTGRARVRAIRHIAGGSHRVFIILSEFATREKLDDLVTAFEELLDELTPYYQERLRWLPDQQREIVEFLCRQTRTVQVKEIAAELFLSEQTAAAQLKSLRDKGYVTSASVGRESRYELAEPLMRLCVEVKDPQREPIRLIVEFLRVWYDRAGLEARLQCLPADADRERRFFQAALQAQRPGVPGPVEEALNQDLAAARATGDPDGVVRVLVELAATADTRERCLTVAMELSDLGRHVDALAAIDRAIEQDPENAAAWHLKGCVLNYLTRYADALAACERAVELKPDYAVAWDRKGDTLGYLDRYAEALVAYDRAIQLEPDYPFAWIGKGFVLVIFDRYGEALSAFSRAIELNPDNTYALIGKGNTLNHLGRHVEALATHNRALELRPDDDFACIGRAFALNRLRRHEEALAAYDRLTALKPDDSSAWNNKGWTLSELGRFTEAVTAFDRAIEHSPDYSLAWKNRGRARVGLGQIGVAVDNFRHAIKLDGNYASAFEELAEAHILQGEWDEAERVLFERFRLPPSPSNQGKSWHLPGLIATIFRASSDVNAWRFRVERLADIAKKAQTERDQENVQQKEIPTPSFADTAGATAPPNPVAMLGDSLIRSLTEKAYAGAGAVDAWADVWHEVAKRHPDLSLAARLFGVGVRFLQTKDERVLLDLVQEERSILRDLFGLDERSDE